VFVGNRFINDVIHILKSSWVKSFFNYGLWTGNEGTLHFYLNNHTDISSIRAAVRDIPYFGGNTNTTGGLRVMRTQVFQQAYGDRPDVPNVCILITDGVPTREVDGLAAEVGMDKNAQIRVLGIGVTNQVITLCWSTVVKYRMVNGNSRQISAVSYSVPARWLRTGYCQSLFSVCATWYHPSCPRGRFGHAAIGIFGCDISNSLPFESIIRQHIVCCRCQR